MANPSTAAGIGTYDKELLDAIKVQAQLMIDPIKGYESRVVMSQFLQAISLTDDDPGINLTKLSQGRVVSRIPKGGPYPRVFSDVTSFFLQPVKIGGRYDNYLEDLLGVSTNVRAAMTAGTFEKLRDDLALTIDELIALALNASPQAKDIYDGSASNVCTAFSMAHLDKMILKLKQKTGVRTLQDYYLILPSTLEYNLRLDGAFDNAPQLKTDILLKGQLPQQLGGLGGVIVSEIMPVKYDSAGSMLDGGTAPTGVWVLPSWFTDTPNDLPSEYRDKAIAASEFTDIKVAVCAWLIHRNKVGYYLDRKPTSGTWDYVEPTKDPNDDSMGAKLKAFVNAAITDTKYLIRGENFKLTVT
jgi:hypothetical protein